MGESRVVIPIFGILDVTGEVIGMWVILAAVTVISLDRKSTRLNSSHSP